MVRIGGLTKVGIKTIEQLDKIKVLDTRAWESAQRIALKGEAHLGNTVRNAHLCNKESEPS